MKSLAMTVIGLIFALCASVLSASPAQDKNENPISGPHAFVRSCRLFLEGYEDRSRVAGDFDFAMTVACSRYVGGFLSASVAFEQPKLITTRTFLCVPTSAKPMDVIRKIVAMTTEHPELMDDPGAYDGSITLRAMMALYGCKG